MDKPGSCQVKPNQPSTGSTIQGDLRYAQKVGWTQTWPAGRSLGEGWWTRRELNPQFSVSSQAGFPLPSRAPDPVQDI